MYDCRAFSFFFSRPVPCLILLPCKRSLPNISSSISACLSYFPCMRPRHSVSSHPLPYFFHSLVSIFSFLVLFPYSCPLRNFRSSFLAYSLSSSYVLLFCPLLDTRPSFSCLIFPSNPLPSFQPFVPLVFSTYCPSSSIPITPCVISLFPLLIPTSFVLIPLHPVVAMFLRWCSVWPSRPVRACQPGCPLPLPQNRRSILSSP
jgi:hypothetical protein